MSDGSVLRIVEMTDAWPTNLSIDPMRESVISAIGSTAEGLRPSDFVTSRRSRFLYRNQHTSTAKVEATAIINRQDGNCQSLRDVAQAQETLPPLA